MVAFTKMRTNRGDRFKNLESRKYQILMEVDKLNLTKIGE